MIMVANILGELQVCRNYAHTTSHVNSHNNFISKLRDSGLDRSNNFHKTT